MITVKKDAIKYKDSDGTMKDSGVLCQIGTFGVDWFQYVTTLKDLFKNAMFEDGAEINIDCRNELGNKIASFENMFLGAKGVKKIKLSAYPVEKSGNAQGFSAYAFFQNCDVEVIDLSGIEQLKPYDFRYVFYNATKLREVIGEIDLSILLGSAYTSYAFTNSLSLEEIRFKKETISAVMNFSQNSLLSDKSIQSIIDGLADLTGGTAQTITFHKDIEAKLSDEQKAQITSKNWTLAFSK